MKKLLIAVLIVLLCNPASAQSILFNWLKSQGGTASDGGSDVTVSKDNFIYTCGNFSSTSLTIGATTLTNAGLSDIFLTKYDTLGNLLWAKRYGSTGNDYASAITADSLGNIYVAGVCTGSVNFGLLTFSGGNYILKINAGGSEAWVSIAANNITINDMATDPAGHTVICGRFAGTATIGGTTVTANGQSDGFVAKYDNTGAFSWLKLFYNNNYEECDAVTVTAAGKVFTGGSYNSPDKLYIGNPAVTDSMPSTWMPNVLHPQMSGMAFRCSLQPNGAYNWAKDDLSDFNDWAHLTYVRDITANANGDVYIATCQSTRGLSTSYSRSLLRKYNSAGTLLWQNQLGVKFWNFVSYGTTIPVVAVSNGKVYAADQFLTQSTINSWGVRAFDESGTVLWNSIQAGDDFASVNALAANASGAYLCGTISTNTFGNLTLPYAGGNDAFVTEIRGNIALPPLAFSSPLEDRSMCPGGSLVLAASSSITGGQAPYTYQWTSTTDPYTYLNNNNIFQPTLSNLPSTASFFLRVTDAAGAIIKDTLVVTVSSLNKPVITLLPGTPLDTLLCNSPYTGLTYTWSTGAAGSSPSLAIGTNAAVYSVTINQAAYPGCIAKSAPFYYKTLKANAGNDTIINAGEPAVLGGYPEYFGNSSNTVNFSWTPLIGLSNGTVPHPLAAPDTTTNYIMILQDGSSITKINDTVKVVVLPTVCPGGSTSFTPVNLPPGFTNHQWQLDKGTGFANLPTFGDGVHSGSYYSTLTITTPPASYYGYRYRCISNNGQTESIVNGIYTLKFGVRWTGAVSSDWHNPANWNCGVKPDGFTDVVVSAGTPNPLVISSNAICHLIKVQPGADITIAPGVQLTITGR